MDNDALNSSWSSKVQVVIHLTITTLWLYLDMIYYIFIIDYSADLFSIQSYNMLFLQIGVSQSKTIQWM